MIKYNADLESDHLVALDTRPHYGHPHPLPWRCRDVSVAGGTAEDRRTMSGDKKPMLILAAPIQEYTDAAFRNAHWKTIGGVDEYYAPFIRLERGTLPHRVEVDLAPAHNICPAVVPQLLVKTSDETRILLECLADCGYRRVDFNFGCPFPKVVKSGYGAGMLDTPSAIREVLSTAAADGHFRLSVKMRLGLQDSDGWRRVLPVLNDIPLERVVLHPRTAEQQYGGATDFEAFAAFRDMCHHAVVFNGDIRHPEDAAGMDAVMVGRGLLAQPFLTRQLRGESPPGGLLNEFHSAYVEECQRLYQQPLQKLKLLWDYFLPDADKRLRKAIGKSRTIEEYLELSERIFRQTAPIG